jgi:predicted SnoaL-like aldol condensation-catalyzing enzyme
MDTATETTNKALVLVAFDTLFHKRDYAAAMQYWSPNYVQHSAHIAPGRDGLFNFVKTAPSLLKFEPGLIAAEGDYVFVHSRLSGTGRPRNWIAVDILRIEGGVIAEHWIVVQDEIAKADSKCGVPMFGERFLD